MWLKKLVAVSMIITMIGMNAVAAIGIFTPAAKTPGLSISQKIVSDPPAISISASPKSVKTGLYSAIKWSVTGKVDGCQGTGSWGGAKTAFGSESTGRLAKAGTYKFVLTCFNDAGKDTKNVVVKVKDSAVASVPSGDIQTIDTTPTGTVYCLGAAPCYGKNDVAAHKSNGNCWGWNGNRVMNISGFDAAYHKVKSGISSIEVSGVCGTDLAPSLAGAVSAGGQTRNHNNTTKANADSSMAPYFVGYFDSAKP